MERTLLWGALGIGLTGWICCVLLSRPETESADAPPIPKAPFFAAAALILIVHLATMPTSPPFAKGHGFGIGFLLGGAAALLGSWTLLRSARETRSISNAIAESAPFFLAIPAAVVPLLFMRSNIIDALLGVAIGSIATNTLIGILPGAQCLTPRCLLPGAAFTTTLTATAALGIYRGATIYSEWKWGATAALLAAAVPLAMLLTAIPSNGLAAIALRLPLAGLFTRASGSVITSDQARESGIQFLRILLGSILILTLAYLISAKLVIQPAIVYVVIIGIVAASAASWVLRDAGKPEQANPQTSALAVLVILAAIMVSYHLLAGVGAGLVVLSGWMIAGIALTAPTGSDLGSRPRMQLLISSLCFGVVFVIYRLASERFRDDLRGVQLTDHYALFGFVFGLILPGLIARLTRPESSLSVSILCAALACLGAIAAPAGILLIWGQKTLLTFLFGLALAASPAFHTRAASRAHDLTALIALGLALAVAQWTHLALPLAALPRDDKLRILAWSVGIIAVLIIFVDQMSRSRHNVEQPSQSA